MIERWLDRWRSEPANRALQLTAIVAGVVIWIAICRTPLMHHRVRPMILLGGATALLVCAGIAASRFASAAHAVGLAFLTFLILFVTAQPLVNAWSEGNGNDCAIGGLLPYYDAANYYRGAVGVNERSDMGAWNERRPLNAALNSVKLRLGGGIRGWMAINIVLIALALFLAAREVSLRLGLAAAGAFVVMIATHDSLQWVSLLSESSGSFFALAGVVMLLTSIRLRSGAWSLAGMFATAVALDARAGAYLVLPLLWCWHAVVHGAGGAFVRRAAAFAMALVVTIAAFLPGRMYVRLWGSGRGQAQANFAYVLYGIAAGNQGYQAAFRDHPELLTMGSEREQSRYAYARAFELIRRSPVRFFVMLVKGAAKFVIGLRRYLLLPLPFVVAVLSVCAWRWRDPLSQLISAVFIGTVLSAPFVMWDGGSRVFAATVPLTMLMAAYGVACIEACVAAALLRRNPTEPAPPRSGISAMFAAALIVILLLAPLIHPRHVIPPDGLPAEAQGKATIAFVPDRSGEWVDVVRDSGPMWVPRVTRSAIAGQLRSIGITALGAPPLSVGVAVDTRRTAGDDEVLHWFVTGSGTPLPHTMRPLLLAGEQVRTARGIRYLQVQRIYVLAADNVSWTAETNRANSATVSPNNRSNQNGETNPPRG